jgi:hypothetical protein
MERNHGMTIDKFVHRNQIIAQYLSEVALHGAQAGSDGTPQLGNQYFREVVSAQERLLNALERLLEKAPGRTVV